MTKKYCKGCGKTYEEEEDWDVDVDENGPFITPAKPGDTEEERKFPQMEGKKWTGTKDYMNDYMEPTDIEDIGE
tara:strand:- start:3384 stop:3605 length:222 start_codon:yes stop_codon:yes gene_type:complete